MFLKSKKKKKPEDLNQRVCKYQRWWQDQTGESSFLDHSKRIRSPPNPVLTREKRTRYWTTASSIMKEISLPFTQQRKVRDGNL